MNIGTMRRPPRPIHYANDNAHTTACNRYTGESLRSSIADQITCEKCLNRMDNGPF